MGLLAAVKSGVAVAFLLAGGVAATTGSCQPPPPTCTVTMSAPASISSAASPLTDNGVLCLRDGVYHQTVTVKHGQIRSYPGETAIIDGTGLSLGSTSHLVDLTGPGNLTDVEVRNSTGRGIRLLGNGSSVADVTVHDVGYEGIIIAGSNNTIDGATVYNTCMVNAAHNTSGGWPAAVSSWQASSSRIVNTTVRNSWGEGIDIDMSNGAVVQNDHVYDTWSALIYLDGSSNVTVDSNTLETTSTAFDRGGQPAYGVLIGSEGGGPVDRLTITNNTLRRTRGIFAWNVTPTNLTQSGNTIIP